MAATREQICESAARKLREAAPRLKDVRAVLGFDGFVDEIVAVVDKRTGPTEFQPVATIAHLAEKIGRAAGQSSNYELVVKQMKLGGNGPIMANALAAAGTAVTYVGTVGYPKVHKVFEELAGRAEVIGIAEPAHTDALEFQDGKLMLGKIEVLKEVNWRTLVDRVGRDRLKQLIERSQLVGFENWTMVPYMSDIWSKLLAEVMPGVAPGRRTLFIDLADPEKRLTRDIADAMGLLAKFQQYFDVTLGLNLKESIAIRRVMGLSAPASPEDAIRRMEELARELREKLGLSCLVLHHRRAAAAATPEQSATFDTPFVQHPKISTGAGDHFNAGFCLGRILGLDLAESLCSAVAVSGYYVRNAVSPTVEQVADFAERLPPPEA